MADIADFSDSVPTEVQFLQVEQHLQSLYLLHFIINFIAIILHKFRSFKLGQPRIVIILSIWQDVASNKFSRGEFNLTSST